MSNQRQQNSTSYPIDFLLLLASNGNPATGLSPTVTLSKPGTSTFSAISGAVTEKQNGWYSIAANATDRNTLGQNDYHVQVNTATPVDFAIDIVAYNPYDPYGAGQIQGVVQTGSTTTVIQISSGSLSTTGNLVGMIFVLTPTGASPNGQNSPIASITSTTITLSKALDSAPASGTTFSILGRYTT